MDGAPQQAELTPGGAYVRLGLASVAAVGLAALIGWWPTRAIAGAAAWPGMLAGLGLATLAALAGLVPVALYLPRPPQVRVQGTLAGMLVRFVLVLAGLLPLVLSGWSARAAAAIWAAIGYVLLLAVDTVGLIRLEKRMRKTS